MKPISRRHFLMQSAIIGAGLTLGTRASARQDSPNEKLNIGIIGVANRGESNLAGVANQNIVALCDIDDNYLAKAKTRFTQAETYNDFRKLLERKDLDAVVISTADHTHAPAAAMALQTGKHVYCEKPLTHTVWEARKLAELAKKHKRVTQMGTQIHAGSNYRRVVELIQSGAIGDVREAHCWVGRVWSGGTLPTDKPMVPPNIHWDLWLGPAGERDYHPTFIPENWRGWWAFGNGTLGDMACHHADLPFWALDLRHPKTITAEGPEVDPNSCPQWLKVTYEFGARKKMPPAKLVWYHGGRRPALFAEGKLPNWGDGTLFIGDKGMLLADYGRNVLLPEKDFMDFEYPKPSIPESIGHYAEWINAIKTNGTTTCNFDYSGALTETVLLGCVAYRTSSTLEWDAKRLKCRKNPAAERLLTKEYREGWNLFK